MLSVVELLQELVRIPSVNPDGDPGTEFTGEGRLAQYVGDYLLDMGMTVDMQFAEADRPNVIGRLKSKKSKYHVLLGPHLDTVSVVGMTIDPFGGKLENGKIWGRGATDTKGPMASMLVALRQLVDRGIPENTDLWFAGLMAEESGNEGIEFLMQSDYFRSKGIHLDFGIAGEPTDLRIVHRHKGALWLKIRTKGKACHASRAELGENAILKMREVMDYVSTELPQAYSSFEDPVLGRNSFNLTLIRGGSKVNIIPDACEVEMDHRSLPQNSHAELISKVRRDLPDCEVEVLSNRPGLNTPANHPFVKKLEGVLKKREDMQGEILVGAPWFADCSVMSAAGIPSIAFGPGSIQQAHTKDEFMEVRELERGTEVFYDFFCSLD